MTGQVSVGLHLGVHNTASTHLQHTLRNISEALIEKGVRYYGPERGAAIRLAPTRPHWRFSTPRHFTTTWSVMQIRSPVSDLF